MTHLVWFEQPNATPLQRGLLEIDIDPEAERYCVQSRKNGMVFHMGVKPSTNIATVIVPVEFVGNNSLQVIIYDETGTYNAAIIDKVQPELVDAKTVTVIP